MSDKTLTDNFAELSDVAKRYLDARVNLFKMELLEKMARIGTYFLSSMLVTIAVLMVLLLVAFAFSFWYGANYGNIATGFIISAGAYVLLIIAGFLLRKQLFANPIVREIAKIIFPDKNNEPS